ncbi:MAG: DNA integrity scanning protein DisA nucleotide-binding domain protein [Desulfovibrionaceae bacterium]
MISETFKRQCIHHILDGLRDGLSHYSQRTRVALIFADTADAPLQVYDPQGLLCGHEPKLKEVYLDSGAWRKKLCGRSPAGPLERVTAKDLDLAGLISYGARSDAIFYQRWFTEHHPDICSPLPIECWLEHAAWLLSQNFLAQDVLYLETAGHVLQQWAAHAVRNAIVDLRSRLIGMDTHLRVYPILDAVLGISKTLEEGAWPCGELAFVEPSQLGRMFFDARFPVLERPYLENFKHVRKLLQAVEHTHRRLVSDGSHIVGVASGLAPTGTLIADFRGDKGFLRLDSSLVCNFSDGAFHASTRKANLVLLEEALLESSLDDTSGHALFSIVSDLVRCAQQRRHGTTLVLDLRAELDKLAGQHLESPLPLQNSDCLELACSLAKVDGALHIGADLRLHGFACLLDGRSVPGENRARGARFNSALRFTSELKDVIVVVVSSDRPVSIIQGGLELTAQCALAPMVCGIGRLPELGEWIDG